jgi:phosphoribosyl 1,2-cyclic phosphodiesterase
MPKGTLPSCGTTGPSRHHPDIRGYVIDETVGSVEVMAKFAGAPDSHDFRVENCEIVLVHAVTTTLGGKGNGKGKGKAGKRS